MMPRTQGLWTEKKEGILLRMRREGANDREVAKATGRSQEAVAARRLRLAAQATRRD